jgi:hypothetical protein
VCGCKTDCRGRVDITDASYLTGDRGSNLDQDRGQRVLNEGFYGLSQFIERNSDLKLRDY